MSKAPADEINSGPLPPLSQSIPDEEIAKEVQSNIDETVVDDDSRRAGDAPPAEDRDDGPDETPDEGGLSEELTRRAGELGFSPEELAELPAGSVERIINRAEAAAFQRFRQMEQQQDPYQQQPVRGPDGRFLPPQEAPPQQFQQQYQQPGPPQQPQGFEIDLDADEYDEKLIKTMRAMKDHYDAQLNQLNSSLQATQQQSMLWEQQQEQEFAAWFDDNLSELGDGSVFGKGSYQTIPQYSEQFNNRARAWDEYRAYLRYQGLPEATRNDELLRRVVGFNDKAGVSAYQKQLSDQLKQNGKQTIGRPSRRKTNLDDSSRNSETGLSNATIDAVQRKIDDMLARA